MTGDRKLPLALALWWALVVLPGVLVVMNGGLSLYGNVTAGVVLVWVVGYVGQLVVFMWASRLTGRNNVIGWLLSALAPWAVDWSAPASLRYPIPIAVLVAGYAWWMYRSSAAQKDLAEHGVPAIGTVLSVDQPMMNMIINDAYIRRTMRLRVERSDGVAPYEVKHAGTFMFGNIPDPGDRFNLRVDPNNPNRIEIVDGQDPQPAYSAPNWTNFAAPPDDSLATGLQKLADLHASGELSDAEFAAAKARLLNG